MPSDLDLKDTRVPTFIPFDPEKLSMANKTAKRKRTAKNDASPSKKKAVVKDGKKVAKAATHTKTASTKKQEPPTQYIWVGAATNEKKGAFYIYFGEKDERNYSQVYEKSHALEDLEYAYVLGTLSAVELIRFAETPVIVNTSCRDLPRAISGRARAFHYQDMADKIRDIINAKDQDLSVRHVSERVTTQERKAALNLAVQTLELSDKPIKEESVEEEVSEVEKQDEQEEPEAQAEPEVQEAEVITTSEVKTAVAKEEEEEKEDKSVSTVQGDKELSQLVDNAVEMAVQANADTIQEAVEEALIPVANDAGVDTQVETIVETTVEVKVTETRSEKEEAEPMDIVQEEEEEEEEEEQQPPKSSWASFLNIQNIVNVLSAPFKNRKN